MILVRQSAYWLQINTVNGCGWYDDALFSSYQFMSLRASIQTLSSFSSALLNQTGDALTSSSPPPSAVHESSTSLVTPYNALNNPIIWSPNHALPMDTRANQIVFKNVNMQNAFILHEAKTFNASVDYTVMEAHDPLLQKPILFKLLALGVNQQDVAKEAIQKIYGIAANQIKKIEAVKFSSLSSTRPILFIETVNGECYALAKFGCFKDAQVGLEHKNQVTIEPMYLLAKQ